MAKEKKIGVIAIAVLFVVFVAVVVMKFTGGDDRAVAAGDGESRVAHKPQQSPRLASGPAQPRYLTAERDASQAPPTSPARPNASTEAGDRYAGRYSSPDSADALLSQSHTPDAAGDPFSARHVATPEPTTTEASPSSADAWARTNASGRATPKDALAHDTTAQQPQRNPLRWDSAEPARLTGAELSSESTSPNSSRAHRTGATAPLASAQGALGVGNQANANQSDQHPPDANDFADAQQTQYSTAQNPANRRPYSNFVSSPAGNATLPSSPQSSDVAPGTYVVGPNENYWTISEAIYGSGKYFKALHEHNRHRYPAADDLHVGDSLDVPAIAKLEELYPESCPKRRHAGQQARAFTVSTGAHAARGGQVYEVQEGDTLFNIAREQLGKAARWAEIYQLNRDLLGDDIDFVSPGMQLVLPSDADSPRDILTRRPGGPLQR